MYVPDLVNAAEKIKRAERGEPISGEEAKLRILATLAAQDKNGKFYFSFSRDQLARIEEILNE